MKTTNYQTMKEAGYTYFSNDGDGVHTLINNQTGLKEIFGVHKNFAGWAIKYKNTHLEFCCSEDKF